MNLRPLTEPDAPLLVAATSAETGRALWGHHPIGPYTLADARQALRAWDKDTSYGLLHEGRLVAAVGVMPDGPGSAEVAYWVRPEERGRGLAVRALGEITNLVHGDFPRLWLEINPANTASLKVAERAGYVYESRQPQHCREWTHAAPDRDSRHDCLIWVHQGMTGRQS